MHALHFVLLLYKHFISELKPQTRTNYWKYCPLSLVSSQCPFKGSVDMNESDLFWHVCLLLLWPHCMVLTPVALYYILKSGNVLSLALSALLDTLLFSHVSENEGSFLLMVSDSTNIYREEGMPTGWCGRCSRYFNYQTDRWILAFNLFPTFVSSRNKTFILLYYSLFFIHWKIHTCILWDHNGPVLQRKG